MSKLFESVILLKCEAFLETCVNQFGFMKCRICSFVDTSKAYDKIDHWLLYEKLLHKDIPNLIVKILVYWYSHQEMFIRWGKSCSNRFYVTIRGKQGGILSPALFNVYMNNLSATLNQSGIGDNLVNHIC